MRERLQRIGAETARFLLAITFLFSGLIKGIDPVGTSIKIGEYLEAMHLTSPESFFMPIAVLLCSIEFMLGAALLMGVWRKTISWIALLMMIFMTLLTLWIAIYNPVADCGCFGDAIKLTNLQTFIKNIVLLLLSIFFFTHKRYIIPAFLYCKVWIPTLGALLAFLFFVGMNYYHLPMLDFRPFKVGISIAELLQKNSEESEITPSYEFIYQKEGVRKNFSLENLPDSTWSYVERIEKPIGDIERGKEESFVDFALFDETAENVTHRIVKTQGEQIWIIAPQINKVPLKFARRLNQLQDLAVQRSASMFLLSGSTSEDFGRWCNSTGAKYPHLFADAITLKTMARGIPSVLFIKDGVIQAKLHARDLKQDPSSLNKQVTKIYQQGITHEGYLLRSLFLIIWFFYTLVSLTFAASHHDGLSAQKDVTFVITNQSLYTQKGRK